ncbi:MAG: UPF0149 family protein [Gammaproteobacteria bacterium]
MLTPSLRNKLNTLFTQIDAPDGLLNLIEIEGLLHAVVITPEIIQPSEWLPKIFNDRMPDYKSIEQAQSVMSVLMDCYNHYNELRNKGRLNYTYDVKELDAEKFDDIIDWGWGFLAGLRLRMPFWMSRIVAEELSIEEDPVANSVGVIKALVDDEFDTTPMIKNIKDEYDGEISEEELEQHLIANLITLLPEAVKIIQEFGEHMDQRRKAELVKSRPSRSKKIGRNEPCPCGSGKKYKKCCALTEQDSYLH